MANLGKSRTNINGAQLAGLRSVKQQVDAVSAKSGLSDSKQKQLSEDIIQKISEKLNIDQENLGQYLLDIQSRSIDETLARIVDVVTKQNQAEFSQAQLDSVKSILEEALAAQSAQNVPEKSDSKEIISKLSGMFSQAEEKTEQSIKALQDELQKKSTEVQPAEPAEPPAEPIEEEKSEKPEKIVEEKSGEYSSLTPAANFTAMQNYIQSQFEQLQTNIEDATSNIHIENPVNDIANQISTLENSVSANTTALSEISAEANAAAGKVDSALSVVNESIDATATQISETQGKVENAIESISQPAIEVENIVEPPKPPEIVLPPEDPPVVDTTAITAEVGQLTDAIESGNEATASTTEEILDELNTMQQAIEERITNTIDSVGKTVEAPFTALEEGLADVKDGISKNVKAMTTGVGNLIRSPFQTIGKGLSGLKQSIAGSVSAFTESVSNVVKAPFQAIGQGLSNLSTSLVNGISGLMNTVGSALKTVALAPLKAIGGMLSKINPFKKKKKKKTAEELKLAQMIDKVNNFIDNFFDTMLGYVDKFLEKILAKAKTIVTKLMVHVFAWLLANVGLIGMLFAIILMLIAKPLMKILQPIFDFLQPIVMKVLDIVEKIATFVMNEVWPFVKDFLIWIRKKILEPIVVPALKWVVETFTKFIDTVIIPLITAIASVLQRFFEGLATKAFEIGKGLGEFVQSVLGVLTSLMKGFGTKAEAIGQAIGNVVLALVEVVGKLVHFIGVVVDIITSFFEGFKTQARAIGEAFGQIILSLLEVANLLITFIKEAAQILIDIVKIIHAPIKYLADFLDGMGQYAKEAGETMGRIVVRLLKGFESKAEQIGEAIAEFALTGIQLLTKVLKGISGLTDLIRKYVIAPIKGITRKFKSYQMQLARDFVIKIPTMNFNDSIKPWKWTIDWKEFHPFDFMTKNWTPADFKQAEEDEGKSASELMSEEMEKMDAQIKAEHEAEEAAKIAQKLQQAKIEEMLKNQHYMTDIFEYAKSTKEELDSLAEKFGIEKVEVEIQPVQDTNAQEQVEKSLASFQKMQDQYKQQQEQEKKAKEKGANSYLVQLKTIMETNFAKILEKLDDQPQLLPLPLPGPQGGNYATMENF